MRILFMGSGTFAAPIARALRNAPDDKLVAVITQPDRPSGRGRGVSACPVKALMQPTGIPVLTPDKVNGAFEQIQTLQPELIVVADYGQYIPSRIFNLPKHKSINVHPSLLPRYRGAAPIPWALANGDTMTGVTIQYVGAKMDTGAILLQQEFEIAPGENAVQLEKRLSEAGAALLLRALDVIRSGHVHATPQDESHATHARKLDKCDGKIDWTQPAAVIANRIRAFQPWPGAFCESPKGSLKVLRAEVADASGSPGTVLAADGEGPLIAAASGSLRLLELQPEGKRPMTGAAFLNGRYLQTGDVLR